MPLLWRRDEISLGMVLTREPVEQAPLLYKVVEICDEPTCAIVPLFDRDGDDPEHYVISSPLFAAFRQVRAGDRPGSYVIQFGGGE
jgi:hypothetical protein